MQKYRLQNTHKGKKVRLKKRDQLFFDVNYNILLKRETDRDIIRNRERDRQRQREVKTARQRDT